MMSKDGIDKEISEEKKKEKNAKCLKVRFANLGTYSFIVVSFSTNKRARFTILNYLCNLRMGPIS